MSAKDRIGNIIKTLSLPVCMYLVFFVISKVTGQTYFTSSMGTMSIVKNTIMTAILAYGAFYNLTSGRFDFSVGAVWLLSGIIAFNFAANNSLSPWVMLGISVIVGGALAFIVGLVYLLLKVPAIVVCLGMMLIYESLSTVVFNGDGITIGNYQAVNVFGNIKVMIAIFAVVFVIFYILNNYTKFGYNTRALTDGSHVAVKIGINERKNVLACWTISGMCSGLAVVFEIVSVGIISPQTNFGSSEQFTDILLPCFLGAFLARYSDNTVGVLVATLSVMILKVGLNGMQIDPNLQNIFNILFLMVFIMYSSMKAITDRNRALKARAMKIAEEEND